MRPGSAIVEILHPQWPFSVSSCGCVCDMAMPLLLCEWDVWLCLLPAWLPARLPAAVPAAC